MSETAATGSRYLDETWRRMAWIAPLALAVWIILLTAFAMLLDQTSLPPVELKPLEARFMELPPPAGLQGGPSAPTHPAPRVVPKVKPHVVRESKPVPRRHEAKPAPEVPPSPFGTAKSSATTAPPAAANPPASSGGAASGGSGAGSSTGMGSDSSGARALYAPTPDIPDDMRDEPFQAVAVAHFTVSNNGDVRVSLTQPTANPRMNQILLDTLKQWRFFPAMKSGIAVDSEFDLRIPITVQ
jgi:protein TonB